MLSPHFWMGAGVTLGAAAVMGLGLGNYVTSPQAPYAAARADIDAAIDEQPVQETDFAEQSGPGVIHCTGCGPTLADRRWQADMAALNATDVSDSSASDYQPDHGWDETPHADVAQPVQPLKPQVARLVAGDTAPPPVMVTRGGAGDTPPPAMVATAAASFRP